MPRIVPIRKKGKNRRIILMIQISPKETAAAIEEEISKRITEQQEKEQLETKAEESARNFIMSVVGKSQANPAKHT